jgi:hypothetical protein
MILYRRTSTYQKIPRADALRYNLKTNENRIKTYEFFNIIFTCQYNHRVSAVPPDSPCIQGI